MHKLGLREEVGGGGQIRKDLLIRKREEGFYNSNLKKCLWRFPTVILSLLLHL